LNEQTGRATKKRLVTRQKICTFSLYCELRLKK